MRVIQSSLHRVQWILLALICSLLLYGCSKEIELGDDVLVKDSSGLLSFRSDNLMELNYEVEVFTRTIPSGPVTDLIDQIAAEPASEKYRVSMFVDKNGEVILDIVHRQPSVAWDVPSQSLPNDLPTPQRTVYRGGILTMYSASGEQLYSTPTPVMEARDLADAILKLKTEHPTGVINDAILHMQLQGFGGIDSLIANAPSLGITVANMSADIKSVTVPAHTPGLNPHTGDVVMLLNRDKNRMLASRLYNADGSVAMSTIMGYDTEPTPVLRMIRQDMADNLPSGMPVVVQTTSTFSGFSLTIF